MLHMVRRLNINRGSIGVACEHSPHGLNSFRSHVAAPVLYLTIHFWFISRSVVACCTHAERIAYSRIRKVPKKAIKPFQLCDQI